jgi:hypothetical protein
MQYHIPLEGMLQCGLSKWHDYILTRRKTATSRGTENRGADISTIQIAIVGFTWE